MMTEQDVRVFRVKIESGEAGLWEIAMAKRPELAGALGAARPLLEKLVRVACLWCLDCVLTESMPSRPSR